MKTAVVVVLATLLLGVSSGAGARVLAGGLYDRDARGLVEQAVPRGGSR